MAISDCALATTTLFTEKLNRKLKNILNQTCKDKFHCSPSQQCFVFYFPFSLTSLRTHRLLSTAQCKSKKAALRICTEVASYWAQISLKQHSRASCNCWHRNSAGKSKHRLTFLAATKGCHSKHSTTIVYIPVTALGFPKSSCIIRHYILFLDYKTGTHQVKMPCTCPDFTSLLPVTKAQIRIWSEVGFVRPSMHMLMFV